MPPASPRTREPLSRARVLDAAVALADAEGVDAVSMRRLADALGVVPMALYKHVSDKEDLLDGMVDTVIASFRSADRGGADDRPRGAEKGDWRKQFVASVYDARTAVARHPWARRAIETRTRRTATVLGHMEALTAILLAGGLSPDLAHHGMHALGNRIWGFSPELFNDPGTDASARRAPSTAPAPDPTAYPSILAVAADAQARRPGAGGCDEDFEFGFALELILDGIARAHEAGWVSPG